MYIYRHRESTSTSVEHLNSFSFLFFFFYFISESVQQTSDALVLLKLQCEEEYIKSSNERSEMFLLHSFSSILFSFYCYCAFILHETLKNETRKKRVKYLIWLNVELISFKLLLSFNRQVNTELKLSLLDSFDFRGKYF